MPALALPQTATSGIARQLLTALLFALFPVCAWSATTVDDIIVNVRKEGPEVAVDVDCPVDAPRHLVWDVLTDYEHMAQFVSNIAYSGIDARTDNVLRVHQKGKVSRGILSMSFDNVREVELVPHREIRSRMIKGDMKASAFTTSIVDVGGRIHIVNVGRYEPNLWIPPVIGPALIRAETQKQFGEIRAEILRRNALTRPPT